MQENLSFYENFASLVGLTKPALTLFLSLLAGYPLALIHRFYLVGKPVKFQHLYFIIIGLALGFINFGMNIVHNIISVVFVYIILLTLGGTFLSVAIVFLFTMTYLLIGYIRTSTNQYDITWTMPYCIITLRLIGNAFDLYDGRQSDEKTKEDIKSTALNVCPTFLQIMAHSFFPSSFLIGPQYPMKRYLDFVSGKFNVKEGNSIKPLNCVVPSLKRLMVGMIYCSIFYTLQVYVSNEYLLSDEFKNLSIFRRLWFLGVWGRYTLYKYITCWLIAEGACIMFGMTYNGKNEKGEPLWDGCENVKLVVFENATEFDHYIMSFNTNTNSWVAKYVYKRLKFMGNKYLSQGVALLFLAVWHGVYSGYYVTFLMEFMVMYMEKDLKPLIKSNDVISDFLKKSVVHYIIYSVLRFYTFVFMGWCLLPFVYLEWNTYWEAYKNVNYVGFLLFGLYPIIYRPILYKLIRKRKTPEQQN